MGLNTTTPSEEDIIRNHKPNLLYSHEFESGRFFQVVHQDDNGFNIKLAPRTMLKAVYIKEQDDIEGIEIIKLINQNETQRIKLSKFNFAQLKAFLSFINEIDLKGITEKRLKIYDEQEIDYETIKTLRTLLSKKGGTEVVEALINEGIITSKDIVNTSFRKKGLHIFESLIFKENYWKLYASENNISDKSEEKVWQYFLEKNEWIFGYGLDYRFQTILQREAYISDISVGGSNTVIADFLLGDRKFTTFVEIKKPSTLLFGKTKNRSNSWTLSEDLINSVSQILEHKASGLVKFERPQYDSVGNLISQKVYDSKVILLIGHWNQIEHSNSDLEKEIKKKTLELFRRDSRNIEILTFDELFERAKYIVEGIKHRTTENTSSFPKDLPF